MFPFLGIETYSLETKGRTFRLETEKAKAQRLPSLKKVRLAYIHEKVWSTTEQMLIFDRKALQQSLQLDLQQRQVQKFFKYILLLVKNVARQLYC